MNLYSEILLDHFMHPRRAGTLAAATGHGTARYETCGDITTISVLTADDKIADIRFKATGCGPGISCASVLTDMVVGLPVEEAEAVTPDLLPWRTILWRDDIRRGGKTGTGGERFRPRPAATA